MNFNTYINNYLRNTIPLNPIPLIELPTVNNASLKYNVITNTTQTEYNGDIINYRINATAYIKCNHYIICYVKEIIEALNTYNYINLDTHIVDNFDDIEFLLVKWNAKDKLDIENIYGIITNTIKDINKEIDKFNNSNEYKDYKKISDQFINIVKDMNNRN